MDYETDSVFRSVYFLYLFDGLPLILLSVVRSSLNPFAGRFSAVPGQNRFLDS